MASPRVTVDARISTHPVLARRWPRDVRYTKDTLRRSVGHLQHGSHPRLTPSVRAVQRPDSRWATPKRTTAAPGGLEPCERVQDELQARVELVLYTSLSLPSTLIVIRLPIASIKCG